MSASDQSSPALSPLTTEYLLNQVPPHKQRDPEIGTNLMNTPQTLKLAAWLNGNETNSLLVGTSGAINSVTKTGHYDYIKR
jgi:hypothetical protein